MALLLEVTQIVAPVFLLAALGFGWVRVLRWPYDVAFVTRLSMTVATPCLIFMALVRSNVDPTALRDTVLAALLAYGLVGAVAWGLVRGWTLTSLPTGRRSPSATPAISACRSRSLPSGRPASTSPWSSSR